MNTFIDLLDDLIPLIALPAYLHYIELTSIKIMIVLLPLSLIHI